MAGWLRRALLSATCLLPVAAGGEVAVEKVSLRPLEGVYTLDAELDIELDREVSEALEHGVLLKFNIIVRIMKKRKWLRDRRLSQSVIACRLEKHALTENYIVTRGDARFQTPSLSEAMDIIGEIRGHRLAVPAGIALGGHYGGLRVKLDIEALPPPMRPIAYASPAWRLQADWFRWPLF